MKEKDLVNETMEELKEEEQVNTNGGNWAATADKTYAEVMEMLGFSCSNEAIDMSGSSHFPISGSSRCTG